MLWCWMDPKKEALPQEEAVSVFCTCPFIHLLSPQKGRRAQGEWACCGLCHLCLAALGSKPVTFSPRDPTCQGLRGGYSGCKLGQGDWVLPQSAPISRGGSPTTSWGRPHATSSLSLWETFPCFAPLSLETWGKWDLDHQGPHSKLLT